MFLVQELYFMQLGHTFQSVLWKANVSSFAIKIIATTAAAVCGKFRPTKIGQESTDQ